MLKLIALTIVVIISALVLAPIGYLKYAIWDAGDPLDDDSFINELLTPLTPNTQAVDIRQAIDSALTTPIIDVRDRDAYDKAHLPGAILIPESMLYQKIPELNPDKTKTIYLYGNTGPTGAVSARLLKAMGYDRAFNLDGGMDYWQKLQYPTQTNDPIYF